MQLYGIAATTANRALKGELENFKMETIERFCLIFHCTPNDLLEWTPPASGNIPESEPLYTLRRQNKVDSVNQLINNVSLEKLEQIETIIRKEMGL
jgi:hypothetical protein